MVWLIAKKDFLLNIISARFITGFLLCLVIIPFTLVVSVDNYSNRDRIYKIEEKQSQDEFEGARVYSGLRPVVVQKPEALSIFSNGISNNIGNKVKIKLGEYPIFPEGHVSTRDNPLLNTFFSIDFSTVIAILIALLALVFSYDAISREREEGTMKLAFTGRTSRISFLTGKITGLLLTLLPILVFCYLLGGLIIMLNPAISLSSQDWAGVLLLFATSIVYMLVFILLGIFISSSTKHSSAAIIISLLAWIWFLFLVPNIATYLTQGFVKTALYENVRKTAYDYDQEYFKRKYEEQWPAFQKALNIDGIGWWNYSGGDDGYEELSGGVKEMTRFHQMMNTWSEPVRMEYADKKWVVQKDYFDQLLHQQRIQQALAWLSPSEIFTQTADILCRTDVNTFGKYMESIRNYREEVINYFVKNNLFNSYRYFTVQPEDEFPTRQELDDIESGKLKSNLSYGFNGWDRVTPLDKTGFPQYIQPDFSLPAVMHNALGRMTALLGMAVALLIGSIIVFMRYDVR